MQREQGFTVSILSLYQEQEGKAIIIPEYFLLGVLKEGFADFGSSPDALRDLFVWDSPTDISRLLTVLNTPGKLNIILGFPPAVVKDNTIALTLGEVDEDDQFIAEAQQQLALETIGSYGSLSEKPYYGTMFSGNWRITVYSVNADLAVRLSYLVKYLLLLRRSYLAVAGLMEQHLSMADFEPIPEYLPDIVFVRAVMFKCKWLDQFRDLLDSEIPVIPPPLTVPIRHVEVDEEDIYTLTQASI